uniref:Interleukin-13 n=1 Tax=Nannospalax galili TaxID=1026970 RepID=A0A8C6QUE5_NANGA
MALWVTVVLALTCLGGFAAPGPVPRPVPYPVPSPVALKELIEELTNITLDQTPLCNSSMVWSVDLTDGGYCAALESLINISNCNAIHKTQRILNGLCTRKASAGVSSLPDTKVEVAQFIKTLLTYSRKLFRTNKVY